MKEVVRKEIIADLQETLKILETKDSEDYEKLKELSDSSIESVALHKDLDMISITVLIYSIYKVLHLIKEEDYNRILKTIKLALKNINSKRYGPYNSNIKRLFNIVQSCNAKVKDHLQTVMQAARIKKGTVLLQKGLSLGQAAGLMGLSNWDLQKYASSTSFFSDHHEKTHIKKRFTTALNLFEVRS